MHLFLKLHQLAAGRGDGLRPEWLELLTSTTSADGAGPQPPVLTVVQSDDYRDEVGVAPPEDGTAEFKSAARKAMV